MGILKKILEIQENEGFEEEVTKAVEITEKEYDDYVYAAGRHLVEVYRDVEARLIKLRSQMDEKERYKGYPDIAVTYYRIGNGLSCVTNKIGPAGFHRNLKKNPLQISETTSGRFIGWDD